MGRTSFLLLFFDLNKMFQVDHAAAETAIQLVETEVTAGVQNAGPLPDKKASKGSVRLHDQRHLPRLGEEVVMQPGIVVREKNAHAWVRVIPADDLLALVVRVDLFVDVDQ